MFATRVPSLFGPRSAGRASNLASRPPGSAPRRLAAGLLLAVLLLAAPLLGESARAQEQAVELTLDSAVERALSNSYRVRQLQLSVEQSRNWLEARQAGLKSSAQLELGTPEIQSVSNREWNSDLERYEIVRENSRQWEMDLSIRQPVILFGYPTNGYLSLNNSMYRLRQFSDEGSDLQYYNRYFVEYSQPLFQPNHLKNRLEEAEIDLKQEKLSFQDDVVDIIDDVSGDYFELYELAYRQKIYRELARGLEQAVQVARRDSATIDSVAFQRLQVELGNAREQINQIRSEFRLEASGMKQRLRLSAGDSIHVDARIDIRPTDVNVQEAVEYGYSLRPRLRDLRLDLRQNEIDLENTKGWNSFRAELEATYGREMRTPDVSDLFDRPENSYSVGFNVTVPIWDWGRRENRIQAQEIALRRSRLRIEEAERDIRNDIANSVQSLREYQDRALTMRENLNMASGVSESSLQRFRAGEISALELIQTLNSQTDTAENLLDAYMGYREALLDLLTYTYYDFANEVPLFRRFDMGDYGPSQERIKEILKAAETVARDSVATRGR